MEMNKLRVFVIASLIGGVLGTIPIVLGGGYSGWVHLILWVHIVGLTGFAGVYWYRLNSGDTQSDERYQQISLRAHRTGFNIMFGAIGIAIVLAIAEVGVDMTAVLLVLVLVMFASQELGFEYYRRQM